MIRPRKNSFSNIMRQGGGCEDCFQGMNLHLQRAVCDVAQPRWVGSRYFEPGNRPRIAILLINPGSGGPGSEQKMGAEAKLFRNFHAGSLGYGAIRDHFRAQAAAGQRWMNWYTESFVLEREKIAQLNIAWCPTKSNKYPSGMLKYCFEKHTSRLLKALRPDIVILSGSRTHSFREPIVEVLGQVEIIETIHYACRWSKDRKAEEAERVRKLVSEKMGVSGKSIE